MDGSKAEGAERAGWVRMIGVHEAAAGSPELAEVYRRMLASLHERPAVYAAPGGDAPNIVRCHGLDPAGLRLAFGLSGAIHWSERSLPWPTRELINTVTSGANRCFY